MKIKKIKVALGISVLLAALAVFMTKQQVETLPFEDIVTAQGSFEEKDMGLFLTYKVYSADDSKNYLGKDLISRGYQPIQITIQNNSSKFYDMEENAVSLSTATPNKVVRSVMKSSIPRSVGYRVAGLIFWPLSIPGTIDGIKTAHGHTKLRRHYNAQVIKQETIAPFTTIYRILFVPKKNYQEDFILKIKEHGRNEKDHQEILFKSDGKGQLLIQEESVSDLQEGEAILTLDPQKLLESEEIRE
jgi:hypothetical protein